MRGSFVGWYPYFFLDPAQVSGPLETVLYCLIAVVLFLGIAAVLVATSRLSWRPRRAATAARPCPTSAGGQFGRPSSAARMR